MALSALVLYLLGLLLAFGVRTFIAWRRTGDTGFRRPDTTAFTPAWWGTVLFVGALVLGLAAPVAGLLGLPGADLPTAVGASGAVLMLLGLVLVLLSQATMGASWRIGVEETERTELVTHGVFAFARNPIFTGMGVLLTGQVLAVPSVLSAVALLVFAAAVQVQVRAVEEPYLLRTHGAAYRDYAARTGRFLPLLGRLRAGNG
ncbi:isoprenylcysteine carboxylmethyltransferase family protein [Thermobifida halotolerans]|uniref:Isoprenylcysteine carboxylmethyltransferase family protein n=1 Tax=Thermobifida halotolerans TaxID=483545 RepID=A0A399G5A1_9ACTN|nr:isoprenylcysteine carboxylmethyltransferase family protein [Thermobifida halotolerans]UOE19985.1 isoprenylcysteine carboxylmethyltransferase family protein [Thermobifida halotolerans]